jgi:predicted ATPase
MIEKIAIKNYKAFREGALKIKPITILLGTNGAGKSSLIQLLLMLTQTFNSSKLKRTSLLINGDLIKMGEIKNIFHNLKTNIPIEISFDIKEINYQRNFDRVSENIGELHYFLDKTYVALSPAETSLPKKLSRSFRYHPTFDLSIETDAKKVFSKLRSLKIKINNQSKRIGKEDFNKIMFQQSNFFRNKETQNNFYSPEQKRIVFGFTPVLQAFDFFKKVIECNCEKISIEFIFGVNKKNDGIETRGIKIIGLEKILLEYSYKHVKRGKHHQLKSDIFDNKILEKYSSKFGNAIDLNNLEYTYRPYSLFALRRNYFVEMLIEFVTSSVSMIRESLNYKNINYVNPLRDYPRRYYFQDDFYSPSTLSRLDMIQLIDLLKERPDIKKYVNSWLKKFNINVDISLIEEVISKIKVNHFGLHLDLTDVGFGISQILPIIAQCYLARPNTITLIEQPEIHLHPKMQADLADLFLETCKINQETRNYIIETHSEYLLKRLRRRISEGAISSQDVCVYFIHPKTETENFAKLEEIIISEKGSFVWPKEFYSEDLNDTFEFLKNQLQ